MRIYVADAFTDRPFAGNPAAVCPLEGPADPAWMQRVAAEMNLSETAFPRPVAVPDADFELRWFTPRAEVNLCGHATLATAHVLWTIGAGDPGRPLRFTTRSGVLTVTRLDDGMLQMDFPAQPVSAVPDPGGLTDALGVSPTAIGYYQQNDYLVEVADEETVRKASPDLTALAAIDARGIVITAPGREHDFVSRFFAPAVGVPEDPVTGSAHCALGPYWAGKLGRDELTGYQASERGGVVRIAVRGDRVLLAGHAVTVLEGDLRV